jgi:hypothetical protein
LGLKPLIAEDISLDSLYFLPFVEFAAGWSIRFILGRRDLALSWLSVVVLLNPEANVRVMMILQRYMQMHTEVELSALGMGKLLCPSGLLLLALGY